MKIRKVLVETKKLIKIKQQGKVYDAATAFANHYLLISHNKPLLQFIRNLEPTSSKHGDLHIKFKIMILYVIVFNSYCGKT